VIRLSVSDLEAWRWWRASETADMTDLLARLAHASPPTPQMEAGRALAKLFERARPGGELDACTVDGWEFVFDLDAEIELQPVREIKAETLFETPSGPVTLVGKADGLGGRIHDQKLTERFDAENYLDSLQWRAYLTMFGASEFVYDVFVGRYNFIENLVTIVEYHRLPFYAYPNMRADVERAVRELADVVTRYLPREAA